MYKQYTRMLRAQCQGGHGSSARDIATWLAALGLVVSACFWFPIQWRLTSPIRPDEFAIALSMGLFMTACPAIIVSMFIPSSRVGRLLGRLHLTWLGQMLGSGAGCSSCGTPYSFWASHPLIEARGSTSRS